jgi:hypothetical protein
MAKWEGINGKTAAISGGAYLRSSKSIKAAKSAWQQRGSAGIAGMAGGVMKSEGVKMASKKIMSSKKKRNLNLNRRK